VNKTAASAAQIVKAHFTSRLFTYNCSSQLRENKQKLYIAYLTSWNNSMRLKIFKKLRTASLNSEFTGSYKKKCKMKLT